MRRWSTIVIDERLPGCLLDPQDGGDGLRNQVGVGERGQLHEPHPSSNRSAIPEATARARRVLPEPPGPVRVSRRCAASSRSTSAISRSRPTKLVSGSGRLLAWREDPHQALSLPAHPGSIPHYPLRKPETAPLVVLPESVRRLARVW